MALDCQLEQEYSEEEWRAFLQCAREGMKSGERLHREFDAKMAQRHQSPRRVEKALSGGAGLVTYEDDGRPRLALWDPTSELLVVATVPEGLVLTAFAVHAPRIDAYLRSFEKTRWLRRP